MHISAQLLLNLIHTGRVISMSLDSNSQIKVNVQVKHVWVWVHHQDLVPVYFFPTKAWDHVWPRLHRTTVLIWCCVHLLCGILSLFIPPPPKTAHHIHTSPSLKLHETSCVMSFIKAVGSWVNSTNLHRRKKIDSHTHTHREVKMKWKEKKNKVQETRRETESV